MKKKSNWNWVLFLIALPLAWIILRQAHALTALLAILVANAGASYLKRFTAAAPIDIEFLTVGAAYMGGYFGFGYALLLVLIGPALGEYIQGGISEFLWVKMASIALTALMAAIMGPSNGALFGAVVMGLILQYILMVSLTHEAVLNGLRRITNAALSAYIIFFVIPLVT